LTMILIDTHCHLYAKEFAADIDKVIERAAAGGVQKFYLPAIDSSTTGAMLNLENRFPGKCIAMMGLHPCYVKENYNDELRLVEDWLGKRKFAAVGEIGIDHYWDKTYAKEQEEAFRLQVEWSIQYNLPIVIHTRNAMQETINIVKEYVSKGARGIFHCFSGSVENANEIIAAGFYLGIGGVVTYPKAGLAEVLQHISLEHLVLETDAPYLTPIPFRGKRNESSYLKYVVEKIAEAKKVSVEEVAVATTANAEKIFVVQILKQYFCRP
jgi:TatD DNase family protein